MGIRRAATQLSGRSIFSNREQDYAKRETNRSPQIRSKGRNRNVIRPFFRRTRGRRDGDVASLRVFMATLRKKIEKDPSDPQYIQTHVGIGYRMLRVETDD